MKKLSQQEVTFFNRVADRLQDKVGDRIKFLDKRVTELAGQASSPDTFRIPDRAGTLVDMTGLFKPSLAAPKTDAEREQRARSMYEMCNLVDLARKGVPEAITELDELRKFTVDLYVRAKNNFAMFFSPINLRGNEQVCYEHTYRNEISVKYVGQDNRGAVRTMRAVKAKKQTFFDMRLLQTDAVSYQLRDINTGTDIVAIAQATVDLAWDLDAQINSLAKTMYDSLLGSFTTTGAKLDRTYLPGGHINTANLPTTNSITLAGNSGSTLFRVDAIRQIMKYCNQWGTIFGAPIRPTGVIMIPSLDATDLSSEFTPTGQSFNPTSDNIIANYDEFNWFKTNWTLVPDVTLAPGYAYPVLNGTVGDIFYKPEFDEEIVTTDRLKNQESRVMNKVIQMVSPQPKRVYALRIRYRT